jgi:hypothetical protein
MAWPAAMITAFDEDILRPFYLFHLETTSSDLYLWSGGYDLSWDSQTWLGNGWFRGLSSIKLNENQLNNNIEIALAGASASVVSLVLTSVNQSKTAIIYLGLFDSSGGIVADPIPLYAGYYSKSEIKDSSDISIISISLDAETSKIKKAKEIRYTDAAQDLLFPNAGDQGLEYVSGLSEWKGYFGSKG